jgi:hypothetical protein
VLRGKIELELSNETSATFIGIDRRAWSSNCCSLRFGFSMMMHAFYDCNR